MRWKCYIFLCLSINLIFLNIVSSFSVWGMGSLVIDKISEYYCSYTECCTEIDVPMDVRALRYAAQEDLFGQPLVEEAFHAFSDYWRNSERGSKPLAMSFQGWPGVGKTHFSRMIIKAFYKNGLNSKYVKRYNGLSSFPDPNSIFFYRERLRREVEETVKKCPRSMFIFEEVNDIPPTILDVIKPMLDYHTSLRGADYKKAIFIFISNTGGDEIMMEYLSLKKPREEMKFADFDTVLRKSSYSDGGLKDSPVVDRHLIDHFVPFLPLEESHIRLCIEREFRVWGIQNPSESMIAETMSVLTFGPSHLPIFSNSGCKRIEKKVAFVVMKSRREL